MRTTKSIGAILSIAALLGCLSLAQTVDAKATQLAAVRDSVVPIVVIDPASQESAGRAKRADDRSAADASDPATGRDVAVDSPAAFWAPLADVPLAAWLLLGTCVLGAGFGPRALRRFEDVTQDAPPTAPDQKSTVQKADLTRPRRSPG